MSNYHPPQPPYSAGYAPGNAPPTYLPPNYHNPYQQTDNSRITQAQTPHEASNYGAYGYNMAMPSFSGPPATAVPPLPLYQGWNRDPIPLSPYTPPNNSQYPGYVDNFQNNAPYYPPASQASYQPPAQPPVAFDDSELKEGDFEDRAVNTNTPPTAYGNNNFYGNNGTGYNDNFQRVLASRTQNYSPQQPSYSANEYQHPVQDVRPPKRQSSDSYSPYVSPVEGNEEQSKINIQSGSLASTPFAGPFNEAAQPQNGKLQNVVGNRSHRDSRTNKNSLPEASVVTKALPVHISTGELSGIESKSVPEAKRKAEAAILNLWPYEVRYQTYIDEGIDQREVDTLFDELRMSRALKPTDNPQMIEVSKSSNAKGALALSLQENVAPAINGSSSQLGREPLEVPKTVSTLPLKPTQPPTSIAAPETSTSLNEKERTIQAKMEALRKSREERAQKAAARKSAKPSIVTLLPPVSGSDQVKPEVSEAKEGSISISEDVHLTTSHPQRSTQAAPSHSPPPPMNSQPPSQAIPGLFLSSSTPSASPNNINSTMYAPPSNNPRKRPVAADFDEDTVTAAMPKRPFGQTRTDERFVINVSDDDALSDDDVAMDLESEANQDSPLQLARTLSENRPPVFQSLPALPIFSNRKQESPNSTAANTPPISQTPTRVSRPEDLQRKEGEIELLKKKIAEAEARKRARQSSSGYRTPKTTEPIGAEEFSIGAATPIVSNSDASLAMETLISIANKQVNADQQRLAEVEAAKLNAAEEVKRNEAERIRLRRLEIEADLPLIESEYQANQRRLEEMRVEMAKIEATVQRNLEQKQKYSEEMARLSRDTELQLQTQKAKLRNLTKDEAQNTSVMPTSSIVEQENISDEIDDNGLPERLKPINANVVVNDTVRGESQDIVSSASPRSQQQHVTAVAKVKANNKTLSPETEASEPIRAEEIVVDRASDHALEAALQEAVRADVDSHSHVGEDVDLDVDMETSYAPDPNELAPDVPLPDAGRSPSYSPVLSRSPLLEQETLQERESDGYEPPEATPPIESPPFSPAPPDEEEYEILDESLQELGMIPAIQTLPDSLPKDNTHHSATDGVLDIGSSPQSLEIIPKPSNSTLFTPYKSPLRLFRAYRFHPDFQQQVPGGLRSLTYSHKIDPLLELCRFELAGGICNDNTCDLLHFKDMNLPDDVILTALGSPGDFEGPRRDEFCAGLKSVLLGLRLRKIRDFEAIASELIAYRRKFLADASKVLPLDGVTI